jgi:hypothetical protein
VPIRGRSGRAEPKLTDRQAVELAVDVLDVVRGECEPGPPGQVAELPLTAEEGWVAGPDARIRWGVACGGASGRNVGGPCGRVGQTTRVGSDG